MVKVSKPDVEIYIFNIWLNFEVLIKLEENYRFSKLKDTTNYLCN